MERHRRSKPAGRWFILVWSPYDGGVLSSDLFLAPSQSVKRGILQLRTRSRACRLSRLQKVQAEIDRFISPSGGHRSRVRSARCSGGGAIASCPSAPSGSEPVLFPSAFQGVRRRDTQSLCGGASSRAISQGAARSEERR